MKLRYDPRYPGELIRDLWTGQAWKSPQLS